MQQTLKKCLCAEKRQATGTNNPSTIASSRIHHSKLSRSAQTPQPHPLQSVRREHLNSRPRQPRTSTVCPKHSPNFWDTASPKTSAHPLGSFWQMACGVNNLFSVEGRRNWGMGQLLELRTQDKENFQLKPRNSVQFSWSVVSNSLQPHGLQHARLPCPSPTPGAYSNSCPLSS